MTTRQAQTTPLKLAAARSMRKLADKVEREHPGMLTHMHMRDAAAQIERGNTQGAVRHLYAATHELTPQTLYRHGHLDDAVHAAAKQNMGLVHREVLRVRDIEDAQARNLDNIAKMRSGIPAGETPASAPRPSTAMNAPGVIPVGRSDGAARGPDSPQPYNSKQFSGEGGDIELVGPKGYIHGWIKVDGAGTFGEGMRPGSFEHLRAIDDLADRAGQGPTGDPAHRSATMQAALHNLAISLAARDMKGAKIHLESAKWGNRREAGGSFTRELAALEKQLQQTPSATYKAGRPDYNPLSTRAQHPGRYVSPRSEPPANVTADVRTVMPRSLTMSAETGRLAVTPAERGKPGGPGLYHVKGLKHSDYLEQIVKALIEKRGMDPGKAYAIARGAIRKWMTGGGKVHPEVRAAAAGAEAEELRAQARAHAHSNIQEIWQLTYVIELTGTSAGAAQDSRQANGKFGSGGQAGAGKGGQGGKNAKRKAALLAKARQDRRKARALEHQIAQLQAQSRAATAKSASATKAGQTGKTASATPAKVTAPPAAAAAKPAAGAAASAASARPGRPGSVASQIAALRGQVHQLLAQAAALTKQAAKL